jgi:hypothetical protein
LKYLKPIYYGFAVWGLIVVVSFFINRNAAENEERYNQSWLTDALARDRVYYRKVARDMVNGGYWEPGNIEP